MSRAVLCAVVVCACGGSDVDRTTEIRIDADAPTAEVSEQFLSVAVDSSQVVGSFFWDPDGTPGVVGQDDIDPYDFSRPKLQTMAAQLAPAYLRIGGTDADSVFYDLSDTPSETPPEPYEYTMTRAQFDALNEFAADVGFEVMFTLNAGPGPRDAERDWTDSNARELVEYAAQQGYPIAMWELGNEINAYPLIHNLNLSGAEFAADVAVARALVNEVMPGVPLSAPSVAFWPLAGEIQQIFEDFMIAGGGDQLDVLTWHYYPQQSIRCPIATRFASPETLMIPENLDELATWMGFVEQLRDEYAPHAEVWLGESGNAQCGGQPGVSDAFEGGFWWLDQLGQVARTGQQVVVRQTLSGSNYGLINEETLEPQPDYFNSLLWRRLMGTRVLDVQVADDPMIRAYAHCAKDLPGAVALIVMNLDSENRVEIALDDVDTGSIELYELSADSLDSPEIELGGQVLQVAADGTPPALDPAQTSGRFALDPRTYAFAVLPDAGAAACQ